MENKVYLIELVGENVFGGRTIVGYINEFDEYVIKNIIKNHNNLDINERLEYKYNWEIATHWVYPTNIEGCDVNVTLIHQLD